MRIATKEPCAVVESIALDDQRVSVPVACGVSHPARVGIGLQAAAVHVDLAENEIFLQEGDHRGSLKDSLVTSVHGVVRTAGQALVTRVINAEVLSALIQQSLRPGLN